MKLDVNNLRYLTKEDFRVLSAVEMGMRNHDLVPTELINAIAGLRHGGTSKVLGLLLRNKLVAHERKLYDGYRLTYPGYDYLALRALFQRGVISGVGRQIGVGKESDIYLVVNDAGDQLALKLQRLGRTSFRAIKKKRDYMQHRRSANWMFMSRLGALKEFAFMKALYEAGFPTPVPVDCNRHCVVMSLVSGYNLSHVRELPDPGHVYAELMSLIVRLAQCGLVHCDFNEFNILINPDTSAITIIDFPQMVSTDHYNAKELFDRDVNCIRTYFEKRYGYAGAEHPTFSVAGERAMSLDRAVEASGFTRRHADTFNEIAAEFAKETNDGSDGSSDLSDAESSEHGAEEETVAPIAANEEYGRINKDVLDDDAESSASELGDVSGDDAAAAMYERTTDSMKADEETQIAARFGRVPEGIRTRPGGRRAPPRKCATAGEKDEAAPGVSHDEVRDKVKRRLEKTRRRQAIALAGGRKSGMANSMKDRSRMKAQEAVKYAEV